MTGRPAPRQAASRSAIRCSASGLLRAPPRGSSMPCWTSMTSKAASDITSKKCLSAAAFVRPRPDERRSRVSWRLSNLDALIAWRAFLGNCFQASQRVGLFAASPKQRRIRKHRRCMHFCRRLRWRLGQRLASDNETKAQRSVSHWFLLFLRLHQLLYDSF
jgi:hypothetical protein